jgi:plastocyanin
MRLLSGRLILGSGAMLVICASLLAGCGGGTDAPAGAPAAPVTNPVDPATAGTITGKILFEGTAPTPAPIKMTADPKCMQEGMTVTDESLLVNADGGLKNVFVYVKDGLGNRVFPVPTEPVVLDQQGCHYVPHVFGVQIGQPVEIRNSDPTLHNVHAVAEANQEFNTGQPIQGMKTTHVFTVKEIMVPFKCDVHGWMKSYVGVLDHPFFAVSATDGSFTISGLPPGTYTIEAVHEKLGTQSQSVTIGEKETANVGFTFSS